MLNIVCDICNNTVQPGDEFGSVSIIMRKGFSKDTPARVLNPKLKEKHFCSKCAEFMNNSIMNTIYNSIKEHENKETELNEELQGQIIGRVVVQTPPNTDEDDTEDDKGDAGSEEFCNRQNRFNNKDLEEVYSGYSFINKELKFELETKQLKLPNMKPDSRWVRIPQLLRVINQSKTISSQNAISKKSGVSVSMVRKVLASVFPYRKELLNLLNNRLQHDWEGIFSLYESGMPIKDILFESKIEQYQLEYVIHMYNIFVLGSIYLKAEELAKIAEGIKNDAW